MSKIPHKQKDKEAVKRYDAIVARITASNSVNPFETVKDKNERIEKAKKDYKFFIETYFKHYAEAETPDFHVKAANKIKRNKTYKGWFKWGRGLAKSVLANVTIPLWLWINDDINFMVIIGQNEDKAKMLLGDLQAEFENNPLLINDFEAQKNIGHWEDGFFVTKSGFIAKALGMGQDPRGLRVGSNRPDYIVADDWETKETIKNPKRQKEYADWFLRSVIPTMDGETRRAVVAQNQSHPQMIFSLITDKNKNWDVFRVNAYNPVTYKPTWTSKYDTNYYRVIEGEIGTVEALAEYNNSPFVEGEMFKNEYIQWSRLPQLRYFDTIVGRWDVAYGGTSTSDYNAVRIWGLWKGRKYLIDCFVKQSKINAALVWIAKFQKRLPDGVNVQIGFEAQFWNDEIYRLIGETEKKENIKLNLIKIDRRKGSKYDHIITMLPEYQNGRIFYNHHLKAHNDTQVGVAQLKGIEPGYKTHDDAPDADVYAFDYLNSFERQTRNQRRLGGKRENRGF